MSLFLACGGLNSFRTFCPTFIYRHFQTVKSTCRIQNPDIPRAGRVGAPGGAAGRGRAKLGANKIIRPGNKSPPHTPRHRRNVASTFLQKHEQAKSYVNWQRNKISGWPAVYQRFINGTRSALCSWLPNNGTAPFCPCKTFSCKACPGKTRTYNGRVGSERPAERPGEARQDWVPTKLFAQETKVHRSFSASRTRRFNVFPQARTSETPFKPTEEQNHLLTRGLSPVY